MMAFSGVRSSWDMFARNCDLCWLAPPARGSSPGPAGTAGRSRSPGPTGWRTSGAGRRPPGGTRPASCGGSPARRRPAARGPAARPAGRGSRCGGSASSGRLGVKSSAALRNPRTWTACPRSAPARRRCRRQAQAIAARPRRAARPASGRTRAGTNVAVVVVQLVDGAGVGAGEADGVRDDGGQHLLEVERRGDGLADLAERLQLRRRACAAAPRTGGRSRWR